MERVQGIESQQAGGEDIRGLLSELAIRLEDTWVVTAEQKVFFFF